MELESTRTVATLQDQVHRAWVQQMEEFLQIARYERDEARKECLHLQQSRVNRQTSKQVIQQVFCRVNRSCDPKL
jgi:hypothetical protein